MCQYILTRTNGDDQGKEIGMMFSSRKSSTFHVSFALECDKCVAKILLILLRGFFVLVFAFKAVPDEMNL